MVNPERQLARIMKILGKLQKEFFWGEVILKFNNGNIVHMQVGQGIPADKLYEENPKGDVCVITPKSIETSATKLGSQDLQNQE